MENLLISKAVQREETPDEEKTIGIIGMESKMAKRPSLSSMKERSGKFIPIITNHFPFEVKQQHIFQYVVHFQPDIDSKSLKQKVIAEHKATIGNVYIFDGTMLFLQKHIGDTNFVAVWKGEQIHVSIVLTNEILPGSSAPLQLYNMLFRKILRLLKLKQIGRHYFDPNRPVSIPQHRVELWPGYFTSINPNERGTMLIADVTHKVLRMDTVLDYLYELANSTKNWKDVALKQLVGQIILTRYNNRTYRIDDIAWDLTPSSKFKKKSGDDITYLSYYSLSYNKSIKETSQPLLVHRHRRKGASDEIIYLVPELCTMTGLSDSMRADFRVMKDISNHTRVIPATRGLELENFISEIRKNQEVKKELEQWGMSLSANMLSVEGRIFDTEKVFFNKKVHDIDPRTGEWSGVCKNTELVYSIPLKHWLLVYTSKSAQVAQELAQNLTYVGSSVGLSIDKPHMVELPDDRKATFIEGIKSNLHD